MRGGAQQAWLFCLSASFAQEAPVLDLQVTLGEEALETGVLLLQLAQTRNCGDINAAILLAPFIDGGLRDTVAAAELAERRGAGFRFAHDLDDLLLGKAPGWHPNHSLVEATLNAQASHRWGHVSSSYQGSGIPRFCSIVRRYRGKQTLISMCTPYTSQAR